MDPVFDDFIAYDSHYNRKFENLFDQDFSLSSPFSENSDSTGIFPANMPKTIKNLLDVDDGAASHLLRPNNGLTTNKHKPFQIIKQKKEFSPEHHSEFTEVAESLDSFNTKEEIDPKLHGKSKRISKQDKPREKIKFKQDPESIMKRVDSRYIPDGFADPELDDNTKKKMIQMIRNRVSAQSSRDKKKMYVQQLEEVRDDLEQENLLLTRDKSILCNRIKDLERERDVLAEEVESLKKGANYLCSKCGCTLECEPAPELQAMESTDSSASSPVALHRGHSRSKNFFGFSLGFAAIMCILFIMNGGMGVSNTRTRTAYVARSHIVQTNDHGICKNPDTCNQELLSSYPTSPFDEVETEVVMEEVVETSEDNAGVFDVINSVMDQFSKLHETYFQYSENNNKDIINLPESFENKVIASENFEKLFADHAAFIKAQNKSSTLFCPTGFEFFKNRINTEGENTNEINFFNTANGPIGLSRSKTLDLEKAEYVQLILPKQSISRLSVSEYSSELNNIPAYSEKSEEENTLIEVWCKIFAIRDVAATF